MRKIVGILVAAAPVAAFLLTVKKIVDEQDEYWEQHPAEAGR